MSAQVGVEQLLIRAAADGEFRYFHTDAAAMHMFRWNGADVDQDVMLRISRLIDAKLLTIESLQVDCPVEVTAAGRGSVERLRSAVAS